MNRDALLQLYVYNQIAHDAVLNAAENLDDDAFTRPLEPVQRSIQQIMVHMVNVEAFYLAACREQPFDERTTQSLATVTDARMALLATAGEAQRYIESLDDADLLVAKRVVMPDTAFELPRWKLLLQPILHSTQHRGELSLLLGRLGHSPSIPDIITHFVLESGQAHNTRKPW